MRFHRRRSDRPDSARGRLSSSLEVLEGRTLLSRGGVNPFGEYTPRDLSVYTLHTNTPTGYNVKHQLLQNAGVNSPLLGNEGKIVSGKDRAGNEWTIVVHGPGEVIVTDVSPNDNSLDDAIDTIQLVGTDINKTYVTGNVVGSFRVPTDSTTLFNRLIDTDGVRSIVLNGFTLTQTVTPVTGAANFATTGIYLAGGVRYLSFHDIVGRFDLATTTPPDAINVIIGDPSTPLTVQPSIHIDSIFNTVFNSSLSTVPAVAPQTVPSVNLIVNGSIKDLSFISTTNDPVIAGQQYLFGTIATTGRTAVQAIGVNTINVAGAATNFTASRNSQPFVTGFSGLNHLRKATFNGPTDAVGLDVNGKVGALTFNRGLGSPTGVFTGVATNSTSTTVGSGVPTGAEVPATLYGTPLDQYGYAAAGLVAGQVTATSLGSLTVNPANVVTQSPTNPDFTQINLPGTLVTIPRPGNALTNAAIISSGKIGKVHIVGNQVNSEIKSGFHYPSYSVGLEGTRAPSRTGPVKQTGSLVNGVTSATWRPYLNVYGTPVDTAGPGRIRGNLNGTIVTTNGVTALGNVGAGFYARFKKGYLPPPSAPTRVNGVLKK